jgi:hypothetical protein
MAKIAAARTIRREYGSEPPIGEIVRREDRWLSPRESQLSQLSQNCRRTLHTFAAALVAAKSL